MDRPTNVPAALVSFQFRCLASSLIVIVIVTVIVIVIVIVTAIVIVIVTVIVMVTIIDVLLSLNTPISHNRLDSNPGSAAEKDQARIEAGWHCSWLATPRRVAR